ncbi:MAG: hypothetical protein GY743_23595 [Planctomycetaceae bacterium]|nr:hypothetical protein [Planctomycetaceae bacterium]
MAGRRSKLTKKTTELICDAISIGAAYEIAAGYGGVSGSCFFKWMNRGRKESERLDADPDACPNPDERRYLQFFHKVYEANNLAAISWLNVINNSAAVDPVWARWLLEKRFAEHYGQAKGANITYNVDVGQLSDEQLLRLSKGEDPDAVFSAPPEETQDLDEVSDEVSDE